MPDPVFDAFLETVTEDVAEVNRASDILQLVARPTPGAWPRTYHGVLRGVEHLARAADGTVCVSAAEVPFTLDFPDDYCRSIDPNLQFRIARVHVALVHPNSRGGLLCLGPHFRPGTRVRPLVQQIYGIICGRVIATHHAFDPEARDYYLRHLDQVRALQARPLWRREVTTAVHARAAGAAHASGSEPRHG